MSSATPTPGSVVGGKYRVVRLLGQGGMGAVFEAENTLTGKRVALKWMHASLASNPEGAQRFLREAQASSRVRHPNVVDVYDVLNESGGLFLVMEYLEGEPLSALMQREGVPLPYVLSLVLPAMRGVAAAHRQGVIHRDVKPDNIFLAREGEAERPVPKVLDFGISKVIDAESSVTTTGAAIGTPLYMSVEQLNGAKDIDARTDVYAFGVILYEIVTGQPPFDGETFAMLVTRIMTEQAIDPKALRPDVPTSLAQLILRAMAKDRAQRFGSLDELIRALEPFTDEHGFRALMTLRGRAMPVAATPSSRPIAQVPAAASKTPEQDSLDVVTRPSDGAAPAMAGRRAAVTPVAIAAGLVLVVAIAAWLALRGDEPVAEGEAPQPQPQLHIVRPAEPAAFAPSAPLPTPAPAPAPVPAVAEPSETKPAAIVAAPEPAASTPSATRGRRPRRESTPSSSAAPAPPEQSEAAPAVAPSSVPTETDDRFRAGKPARDDF